MNGLLSLSALVISMVGYDRHSTQIIYSIQAGPSGCGWKPVHDMLLGGRLQGFSFLRMDLKRDQKREFRRFWKAQLLYDHFPRRGPEDTLVGVFVEG